MNLDVLKKCVEINTKSIKDVNENIRLINKNIAGLIKILDCLVGNDKPKEKNEV